MKKDAEIHAQEDKKKKELIDSKNMAETLIFSTEKTLKEFKDKVKENDKKEIDEKIEALKKVKDSESIEEIKKASDELSQAIQKVGSELYKAQQQAQKQDEKNPDVEAPDVEEGEIEEDKN